ncbi:hypothetical protein CRG98_014815 [Punica granatum]|uniref:Uncharacterized protein n=1 Tax=Punica granatum TaxID=22663 RepID=A0A2I0K8G1_PUNGR|nr:hypothetical protein CRG98_014815 [Punica granatum]
MGLFLAIPPLEKCLNIPLEKSIWPKMRLAVSSSAQVVESSPLTPSEGISEATPLVSIEEDRVNIEATSKPHVDA